MQYYVNTVSVIMNI